MSNPVEEINIRVVPSENKKKVFVDFRMKGEVDTQKLKEQCEPLFTNFMAHFESILESFLKWNQLKEQHEKESKINADE